MLRRKSKSGYYQNYLGTMGYLAPEHREGGVIAHSADLYSLGVIIIEILTGQKGYQATDDVRTTYVIVRKIKVQFPFSLRRVDF